MVLAGVVGKLALPFSAVGVPEVLGEELGVPVLSLSSTDSTVVGLSGAAEKGGALPNTGGLANSYTELVGHVGQEQGVCEDSGYLMASGFEEILLIDDMQS